MLSNLGSFRCFWQTRAPRSASRKWLNPKAMPSIAAWQPQVDLDINSNFWVQNDKTWCSILVHAFQAKFRTYLCRQGCSDFHWFQDFMLIWIIRNRYIYIYIRLIMVSWSQDLSRKQGCFSKRNKNWRTPVKLHRKVPKGPLTVMFEDVRLSKPLRNWRLLIAKCLNKRLPIIQFSSM